MMQLLPALVSVQLQIVTSCYAALAADCCQSDRAPTAAK